MEKFVVSARKYRPSTFSDVVGQKHVTDTLRNALLTNQVSHAYLFSGPRGVGKTTCARILAKAVNCENLTEKGDPCNECPSCTAFNEGKSVNIFELDAASNNKVEDIRNLIEQVRFVPQAGRKSVYIIDEVHMLTTAAFNAFLKTLEEPPEHAIFIMATTEKHKILPTILSRCQQYDFKRIPLNQIVERLKFVAENENIKYETDALQLIAIKSEGAMRDALSIFDQLVNFTKGNLTYNAVKEQLSVLDFNLFFDITFATIQGNTTKALNIFHKVINDGYEIKSFLTGLIKHFRNSLILKETNDTSLLDLSDLEQKEYKNFIQNIPKSFLINALNIILDTDTKFKLTSDQKTTIELLLVKLSKLYAIINSAATNEKKNSNEQEVTPTQAIKQEAPQQENNKQEPPQQKSTTIPKIGIFKNKILSAKPKKYSATPTKPKINISQEFLDKITQELKQQYQNDTITQQLLNVIKFECKKIDGEDRIQILLPSRNFLKAHLSEINKFTRYIQQKIGSPIPITRVIKPPTKQQAQTKKPLTRDVALEKIKKENPWINKLVEDLNLELE